MLKKERERGIIMKAKSKISVKGNYKGKGKAKLLLILACIVVVIITVAAKGNHRGAVGYTYDTASTLWEMGEKHCPNDMDIRDFVSEIAKVNGIEDSVVYEDCLYKIPVYEIEREYLDMNTVVGYEASDDGVLLLTNDGDGYFIEK